MDELEEQARVALDTFVSRHPAFLIDSEQSYRGGTNRVLYGQLGKQPVVFKYFVTASRWHNELFCLRHFEATGMVPRVLETVPERLIVMTRLAGDDINAALAQLRGNRNLVQQLSTQVGQALGKLANHPLPDVGADYSPIRDFDALPWDANLREVLQKYLRLCWRIHEQIPAYRNSLFHDSLALLETQVETIDRQRRLLFHEDISNMTAEGGNFQGFYDLEMCRLGTEAMQLGVAVGLCGPEKLDWPSLRKGYEREVGRHLEEDDLLSVLSMSHFYHWIRVCRWGLWDGNPDQQQHRDASEQQAAGYFKHMEEASRTLSCRYL